MYSLFAAALLFPAESLGSPWSVSNKLDPMTDRASVSAHAVSADGIGLLAFRCVDGQFDAMVMLSRSIIHADDLFKILIRIDGGEVKPYGASGSVDRNTAFVYLDLHLSAAVARARQAVLIRVPSVWTVSDGRTFDRDLSFPVDGAAQAIDQVRKACGQPTLYETLVQPVPQVREPGAVAP